MSDKYIQIANFKYGLDSRRSELTSQPGTLVRLEDAHITQGGEIEKRLAFVKQTGAGLSPSTFGFEVTDQGPTVFGSADPPIADLPAGVVYQQLVHPYVSDGINPPSEDFDMTAVIFSTCINGKAVVAAEFEDGNVFLYYDGELVTQSRQGLVLLGGNTLANIAIVVAALIVEETGWLATPNVDENGNAEDGSIIVKSPVGVYFTPTLSETSVDGQVGYKDILPHDVNVTPAVKASTVFTLSQTGVGTVQVEAPQAAGAQTPQVDLAGGAVNSAATAALTAAALVQAINDLTFVHGYTALANAAAVTVYAPETFGVFTLNLVVTCTGLVTDAGGGGGPVGLSATITPSPLIVNYQAANSGNHNVFGYATCAASGGTAPYKYFWSEASTGSGGGITITQVNGVTPGEAANAQAKFSKSLAGNGTASGSFKCLVTDFVGATILAYLTVNLNSEYDSGL